MRSLLISLLIFTIGCSRLHYGIKSGYDFPKIKRVAVWNIQDYPEFKGSGEVITGQVILELIKDGYEVIERSKLATLFEEHKLALSGVLDAGTIGKIGDLAGVDMIITGAIAEYLPKKFVEIPLEMSQRGGERISSYYDPRTKSVIPIKVREADSEYKTVKIRTIESSVGLNLRMIDVKTGLIIWSGSYSYNSLDINHAIAQVVNKILKTIPVKAK